MITIEPRLYRGDVDGQVVEHAKAEGRIAWDIETTGLSWSADSIGTCQIAVGDEIVIVQTSRGTTPPRLRSLLEDESVLKIFHHAPFDLRFMAHHWAAGPVNVACTKIASKIVDPDLGHREHSLRPALKRHLGVEITKDQQRSDWADDRLSSAQVAYAATDVKHLVSLYDKLLADAVMQGVAGLVAASYAYLPSRVQLDLRGAGDVFAY